MPRRSYDFRGLALFLALQMSFLTSLSAAWKNLQQRSFAGAVQAFLRGDDVMDLAGADRLSNPYAQSVWVQRAIKRCAEPIGAVEVQFFDKAGQEDDAIEDPMLQAFWESPALDRSGPMDRADVIEASVGWLKLAGECFWLLGDDWLTTTNRRGSLAQPFLIARPDRMRPVIEENQVAGWMFTDASGRTHPLVKEQVIHRKFWNPYDDLRGLSEFEAARVAAEGDYLAGKFALNMNRANGDRGVYVVAKGGMPSDQQQAQIIAALREKRNAARRGDFRPMFLTGDVAIEDPKVTSPDADFAAQRIQNRHEIFIAFGVPPSMCDLVASYSVGAASDWYQLILQTCQPLANGKLAGAIEAVSKFLLPGRTLKAKFNFDDHPVMQAVRRERIDTGKKLWESGVPWDVISEHLDLGLPSFAGSDTGYLPFNVTPVGDDGAMLPKADAAPANASQQIEDDPVEQLRRTFANAEPAALLRKAFKTPATLMRFICPHCGAQITYADQPEIGMGSVACPLCDKPCDHERKSSAEPAALLRAAFEEPIPALQLGARAPSASPAPDRDPARVALAMQHLRSRGPAIKRAHAKFTKALMLARGQTLKRIASAEKKGLTTKASAADLVFDLNDFTGMLTAEMRKAGAATLDEAGQQVFGEVGIDDVFTMPPAKAQRFLDQRENLLKDVAQEVFDDIKGELKDGLDAGDSTAQLADRIRGKFNQEKEGRAMTVAHTEVSAAYGTARQEAMDEAGIEYKEWLTSGLSNVRAGHLAAEGQVVRTNDPFMVPNAFDFPEPLQFPGDPDGSPGNVINCHCVAIAARAPKAKSTQPTFDA